MITIEPVGGLGNQLFIYALGLANSLRLGVPLVADLRGIQSDQKRGFELSSFENSLHKTFLSDAPRRDPGYQLHRALRHRFGTAGRYKNLHYELFAGFDERFLNVTDGSRLRGYFQSWKYVEPVKELIREQVWKQTAPSMWFENQVHRLSALRKWTAIHVRLGDYQELAGMEIAEEYFARSIRLLDSITEIENIVVFSDDVEGAKEMTVWNSFPRLEFLETPPESRPLESLLLMSLATNLIISNSTFSWWAARLSVSEKGVVIFPRPWGNSVYENRDLIPPEWLGVGREIS